MGFLEKQKKAYTPLTVVICCQIFDMKSVVPSRGDFWQRPALWYACVQYQELSEKKLLVDPFRGRSQGSVRGSLRECLISGDVNLGPPGPTSPQLKI